MEPLLAHGGAWQWTLAPLEVAPLALAAGLYARRARTLRRRGRPLPRRRPLAFAAGLALAAAALVTPLAHLAEERLFSAHMLQHLVIGDIAALLVVAGLTGPLLRPVLALPAVGRLRALAHPLVALPLWGANLYAWHLPALYQAALTSEAVHALEHALFFGSGALMWTALLEPLPGPAWFGAGWKVAYVLAVRAAALVLGNVFLFAGQVFYPFYARVERLWGLSALADQQLAGALMLVEGSVATLAALAWILLRFFRESEARQRLLERGALPSAAARAARYDRAESVFDADVRGMGRP